MAVYVTKACASQWPRRATKVALFLVSAAILMTFFASTNAVGQAATPSPRAPVPRGNDELVHPGDRPDDRLMTLNQAVDRFLKGNLELRALHHEIPMAQADVEAAGQPPQEQIMIEVGPDGIRASRVQPQELIPRCWIDTLVARAAKRVLEAQYEDAVRTRVDRLYTAFMDLEEAQRSVSFSESGLDALETLLKLQQDLEKTGQTSAADVARIKTRRALSTSAVLESKAALQKAKLQVSNLLNLSDTEAAELKARGDLEATINQPRNLSPTEELIRLALNQRPDLKAYRLGLVRAHLEWLRALIEPLNQVAWRRWPGEMIEAGARQVRKAPPGNMTVLFTLPTMIRNKAKLKRESINVEQSGTELAKVERAVVLEVRRARLEFDQARSACDTFRSEILPNALQLRNTLSRQFREGEVPLTDYLSAQQEYNDSVLQVIKASVRLRRSALALNTAVGARVMP